MRYIFFIIITTSILAYACNTTNSCINAPDVSNIDIEIKVERLEQELFKATSETEVEDFLKKHPVVAERFLANGGQQNYQELAKWMFDLINNPSIDTLYEDTEKVFGNLEDLKTSFKQAFQYIKYYYPDFDPPVINTMISGLSADLYVSDSLIIIGLDVFQGEDARYRPKVYDYMLKRYQPDYIVPNTLLFLSSRWNDTDNTDNTMMAEMIYFGKSFHFVQQMMPCTPDSLLIGYSDEELELIADGEGTLWKYLIDNQLLYETSHIEKDRYLNERPATIEINGKIPGRIGRWIGWQIVDSFAEKNEAVSLQELMKMKNAEEIFRRAKYKP